MTDVNEIIIVDGMRLATTDDGTIVRLFGNASAADTHLLATVVATDGGVLDWLAANEPRIAKRRARQRSGVSNLAAALRPGSFE